jgi:hypothetical protein
MDAEDKEYIVTVSDTKLTTGFYSSDMATLKLRHLTKRWKCLISGKFAQHRPLLDRIRSLLAKPDAASYADMAKACTDAFIGENKRLAEESILAQYGMTMEDFIKSRDSLGDALYERLWGEIGRIKLGCDLLVCGFDNAKSAHIFIASNPSDDNPSFVTDCDFPGFAAIGTGSYLAESVLHGAGQNSVNRLSLTIYNTATAKFLSESATDVGEQTYIYVFDESGNPVDLDENLDSSLRDTWLRYGQPKTSEEMYVQIREALPKNLQKE